MGQRLFPQLLSDATFQLQQPELLLHIDQCNESKNILFK